ncbi:hypothetical protein QIH87_49760 (plasmid) [Bradyrhizobium elkanii]|uniref:hypothetical protein n=1 Tax=Bradyrhizobium elkanii TaxID=29448 RepID=UPI002714A416|nr:hypothetical protein [Bradyrhizobium elkanii]WLB14817.1 hypothetical protein QIH87_49760 [Bradyrhizobium elkanii]WLB69091.1 hypothetical protein QIH89_27645 [Bradyrhizobium elkanii]
MSDWPDWNGRAVAIIASGPSAKKANVGLLRGLMPVIAIKKSVELAPWADVVYGCDHHWWRDVRGLMNFKGLKLAYDRHVCGDEYGIRKVEIPDIYCNKLLFGKVGTVGAAGNSGFQALNLAVQFGASRILLVGFDMNGEHWYGRNGWAFASNPTEDNFRRWRAAFDGAASDLSELGIDVINASPGSSLKAFRKMSVEQALREWGLQDAA